MSSSGDEGLLPPLGQPPLGWAVVDVILRIDLPHRLLADAFFVAFHKKANTDRFLFYDALDCLERGMRIESTQASKVLQKNVLISLMDFSRRLGGTQVADILSSRESELDAKDLKKYFVNSPDCDGFHLYSYAALEELTQSNELEEDENALREYLCSKADLSSAYTSMIALHGPHRRGTFLFMFLWIEEDNRWKILHGALSCWYPDHLYNRAGDPEPNRNR